MLDFSISLCVCSLCLPSLNIKLLIHFLTSAGVAFNHKFTLNLTLYFDSAVFDH